MKNDGKELERLVSKELSAHKSANNSHFIRFYDATSSGGGAGHRNAGDFQWLLPGAAVLIECKSTVRGDMDFYKLMMLSKKNIGQMARHRLWHRAGHPSIYIYADIVGGVVIVYGGCSVVAAIDNKDPFMLSILAVKGLNSLEGLFNEISDKVKQGV